MPSSYGQPQQHKQPSRKGKKAWRKNVDITEVQEGLETLREEIRHGGPLSEKPNDELLVVDTEGSADIRKKHNLSKPLKVDEILAQRSAVPSVDSQKRARVTDGVFETSRKRQKKDWVSKKEVQRLKQGLGQHNHLSTEGLGGEEAQNFDLWDVPSTTIPNSITQDEYVPESRAKVAPETLRRRPVSMTADGKAVRAIQDPNAGTSYNPAFESWADLLEKEGEKEVEAEKARREQARKEAERQTRIAVIQAQKDTSGQSDYESAWEGFDSDEEKEKLKQKRPTRKTPSERNKAKRKRLAEQQARHEAAMGRKQKQAEQVVDSLIKANPRELTSAHDESAVDAGQGDDSKLRRRKLGKIAIADKPLELVLPDELQESLRRLKPEGNLMNDRFRNLLVNGKIESRKPIVQRKQRKRKMTEKWSYKDFGITV